MIQYISENQITITSPVRPTKDNGYGIQVPDIDQTAVPTILGIGRVCRRRLPDPIVTGSRTPYDYQDVYYLLVQWDATWLKKGITFQYNDEKWKTKLPEKRRIFGEITYRLCDLEQITSRDIGDYNG
jgi:hypothetical protein